MQREIAMIRFLGTTALALTLAGAAAAQDVEYEVGGEAFEGYFAKAENARGLVVIVHDWDGLDDYERRRADMLAELGYDAFALDVYGAGNRPDTNEGRAAATQAAFADPERLAAMIGGSIETARGLSDAENVVLMGYCFGGTVTLAAARNGMAEGIVGYASFHGNFPEGPAWASDTAPILILHGGADSNPDMAKVSAFAAEAEAAGLTYDIEVYSGAPHAFTVFGSERYRERADMKSWAAFQTFLNEILDGPAS
jgi:dienelactone hydrolase